MFHSSPFCLLYFHHPQKNQEDALLRLAYFLRYGVNMEDHHNKYLFLMQGVPCEVDIPQQENIFVHRLPKHVHDSRTVWQEGVEYLEQKLGGKLCDSFEFLFTLDGDVVGPLYPPRKDWWVPFFENQKEGNFEHVSVHGLEKYIRLTHFQNETWWGDPTSIGYVENADTFSLLFPSKAHFIENQWGTKCIYDAVSPLSSKGCVLYAHYDADNIIRDYVIHGVQSLQSLGYEVLFYTASPYIENVEEEKLSFSIHYYSKNIGFGTDQYMWLEGLKTLCNVTVWYGSQFKQSGGEVTLSFLSQYYDYVTGGSSIVHVKNDIFGDVEIGTVKNLWIEMDSQIFGPFPEHSSLDLNTLPPIQPHYEWIMLMNDSSILPLRGVGHMKTQIEKMRTDTDFWGHWDSSEVRWHIMGIPFEFHARVFHHVLYFLCTRLKTCVNPPDYVLNVETKLAPFLVEKNFRWNVVVPKEQVKNSIVIRREHVRFSTCTPSHNPFHVHSMLSHPDTFAVKFKYCLSYLHSFSACVTPQFRFLAKYLWFGYKGVRISKGEQLGGYIPSKEFDEYYLSLYGFHQERADSNSSM